MVNKVILVGRLTNTIQLQKTSNGGSFARICLACDRKRKDPNGNRQADFPSIKVFGKLAEFISVYGHKGGIYAVIGHISTNRQEKEGRYEYFEDIIADDIQIVYTQKAENNISTNNRYSEPESTPYENSYSMWDVPEDDSEDTPF